MELGDAVVTFDLLVVAVLGLDFVGVSRTSAVIVPRAPGLVLAVILALVAARVDAHTGEFVAIGVVVLAAALFAYVNFLAFVKRGITFSILVNHARPHSDRIADREFIALDERVMEMHGHAWVESVGDRWRLTARGRRVLRLRRSLLRLLRSEAVG